MQQTCGSAVRFYSIPVQNTDEFESNFLEPVIIPEPPRQTAARVQESSQLLSCAPCLVRIRPEANEPDQDGSTFCVP
jgi:hypothetical protein